MIIDSDEETDIVHTYVLSWDCTGLESVICISDMAKEETWAALLKDHNIDDHRNGRRPTVTGLVHSLMMRARFNPQRFYEIYAIDVADGITSGDIREWFDSAPQQMAELIRARGRKIYSDRRNTKEVRIT